MTSFRKATVTYPAQLAMPMPAVRWRAVFLAAAVGMGSGAAAAGPIRSVAAMTFADNDTLIVADWRGGELHALKLRPAADAKSTPFNLKDVAPAIARALHARADRLRFEDMAFRPGSALTYIALSVERASGLPVPALVAIDAGGQVQALDLAKAVHTSIEIKNRPTAEARFWNEMPAAAYTVTDLLFHEGKVYVAGLSNASFASTLRVYDFPFTGASTTSSVEMYHAVHDQVETRAPIRKMAIATLNGEPSLIAAYTCTPLVTIPLKDLKDGAHVVGKTVAELGWGSAPVGMVSFDAGQGPMVLLTNSHKSADLMTVAAIAAGTAQPGLHAPIEWPAAPYLGVKAIPVPLAGVAKLSTQDQTFLVALRRDEASGAMQLVSIRKGAFLRVSDFINEFDFADFRYAPKDPFRGLHQVLRGDEGYPNLAARAAP